MSHNQNYDVVVGIDFGSSGSGIAYSFMNETKINHIEIFGADSDKKVPTEIILDEDNYIIQFGFKCRQSLIEKGLNLGHYFKNIKMELYHNNTKIKSINSDKVLPLELVIEKVLERLKELCLKQIRDSWKNIDENRIKWVVTVPTIWGNFQKSIMIKACENIGLINRNNDESLFFALEPEAASIYCSRCGDIKKEYIEKGKFYIICDLGGGTGDIVTHLVGSNDTLKEIVKSDGDIYGSNEIDKKIFNEIIYKVFGYKDFNSLYEKFKYLDINEEEGVIFGDWCDLERQIKLYKEGSSLDKVNNKIKFPICCNVFEDFFDDEIDLNDLINKYNRTVVDQDLKLTIKSKKKWIIDFPYKIIYSYILEQSKEICKKINNILTQAKEEINTVIFVGGYCSNEILISLIKELLKEKITNFLIPSKPSMAVMEGAVLFGLNTNIITIRIAKYTVGMAIREEWNEFQHKGKKKLFCEEENKWYCDDCFSKFIEINQKLEFNQIITKSYSMSNSKYCTLIFYQTLKPNPKFVFEKGIEKMGQLNLKTEEDFPIGEREINVSIKFGGTYIDIKAIHLKSQKYINGNLKFIK